MKHNNYSPGQSHKPASASQPMTAADLDPKEIDFALAADEVARRACFSYVNQSSLPERDVQHWLEAETELLAERDLTRVHGFHNRY